ncbi:MAG: hypothetical protein N2689_04070, partial [Verrucomicrobiae bacterium]|nr:hypothetical protein [Verrucomicrobiae bacterium]
MGSRLLDSALWLLVFLLPVKFGGLVIMPDRPETFSEWWLGRWPVEIAIACALLWVAVAFFHSRRREMTETLPRVGGYGAFWLLLLWLA